MTTALALCMGSGCGGPVGTGKSSGKKSLSGASAPLLITAAGNDCKPNGVATTDPGKPARIALNIQGASVQTHALVYLSDANIHLTFNEAVLPQGAGPGTYKATLILMDRLECRRRGGAGACEQTGARLPADPGFGEHKTISFIVTNTANQFVDTSTIGRGQEGVVSDLINGEGLLGTVAGLFAGGGGGLGGLLGGAGGGLGGVLGGGQAGAGGLGGIGNIVGSGDAARASGFMPQGPTALVGGCTGQANIGTSTNPDQIN